MFVWVQVPPSPPKKEILMEINKTLELRLIKIIEDKKDITCRHINKETFMGEYVAIIQEVRKEYKEHYVAFLNFNDFNLQKTIIPLNFYGINTYHLGALKNEIVLCPYDKETDTIKLAHICLITY